LKTTWKVVLKERYYPASRHTYFVVSNTWERAVNIAMEQCAKYDIAYDRSAYLDLTLLRRMSIPVLEEDAA
jgi:hypothetical protein